MLEVPIPRHILCLSNNYLRCGLNCWSGSFGYSAAVGVGAQQRRHGHELGFGEGHFDERSGCGGSVGAAMHRMSGETVGGNIYVDYAGCADFASSAS